MPATIQSHPIKLSLKKHAREPALTLKSRTRRAPT